MARRRKTGGRKAGTPNRKTQEIHDLLESLGHNPIEAMVSIATDPKASLELRGRMNAELAQYVYPKRKAVELAGVVGVLQEAIMPGRERAQPTLNVQAEKLELERATNPLTPQVAVSDTVTAEGKAAIHLKGLSRDDAGFSISKGSRKSRLKNSSERA